MNQKKSMRCSAEEQETAMVKGETGKVDQESLECIRLISTQTLQEMLSCCYRTAVQIGTEANARIKIGSMVRWKVNRINEYLESTCAGGDKA